MSKQYIKIITDLKKFEDRTDEILSAEDPIAQLKEIQAAIHDMKKALMNDRDYVCICAPQVGFNLRMFMVKTADTTNAKGRYKTFLNPMIVNVEGIHLSKEMNLSIPNKRFIVPRYNKVHVAYQDDMGHVCSETYIGSYGEVVQQMIQMLDGITLADIGLEIDDDFEEASEKDQRAILQMYLESLREETAELNAEIEANDALKNINDIIKMQTGLLTGNIVPLDENGNPIESKSEEPKE